MTDVEQMYLRPKDVATELGLTVSAIYKMMERGSLPAVRFGGSKRIPAAAYLAWKRACEEGSFQPRMAEPSVAGSWACPKRNEEQGHWLFAGLISTDSLPIRCRCGRVMQRV